MDNERMRLEARSHAEHMCLKYGESREVWFTEGPDEYGRRDVWYVRKLGDMPPGAVLIARLVGRNDAEGGAL